MLVLAEGGVYRISTAGYKRMLKAVKNGESGAYPSEFGGRYIGYTVNVQDMTAEDAANALEDLKKEKQ